MTVRDSGMRGNKRGRRDFYTTIWGRQPRADGLRALVSGKPNRKTS